MNLVPDSICMSMCCRCMARATVPLNFNAFLEKAKLKDDGSNYTDWVRNLRIILIAAQKNYVLDAPLGERPVAGADADVTNVLHLFDGFITPSFAIIASLTVSSKGL